MDRPGGLFECISMERSGSPEGYNAETGFCEPAQKPQTGEPNEHSTLYRIRCSQEKHQLLRQDSGWNDCRRGQTEGNPAGIARVGKPAEGSLAWCDGSDPVQRLDLRRAETVCGQTGDRKSSDDESHRGGEEEERQTGRAEDCRPGALQSAAGLLCAPRGDARVATAAEVSQHGGGARGADEEQNERSADGSGGGIQQAALARKAIFHRTAGRVSRSAGFGEGYAAAESQRAGDVRGDTAADPVSAAERAAVEETSKAAAKHPWSGRSDVADLGPGSLRPAAICFDRRCGELLRADVGTGFVSRQAEEGTDLQTAQSASAKRVDRSRETGAAVESAVGRAPRTGIATRPSEPGDVGGSTQAGCLPVGGGQIRQAVRGPQPAGTEGRGGNESGLSKTSELTSGKGDFPTGAARRQQPGARTVLAVKGSLRRAKSGRALDCCGPFRRQHQYDGRLRRENHQSSQLCVDTQRRVSDSPAVPRSSRTARRRPVLPMCPLACFEAGRFTSIQNSWTAIRCSCKWMSGHADALIQPVTNRIPSIVTLVVVFICAFKFLLRDAGRSVFSLDKYLSWMSYSRRTFLLAA